MDHRMIERATLEDLEFLVECWIALASDQREHGSSLLGRENETAVRESLGRRVIEDRVFVAREDNEPVGFVSVGLEDDAYARDVQRGVIENVYVEPDYRERGHGTALIERGEAALRSADAAVVTLEVLGANEDARRLYESLGYARHRIELEKRLGSDSDKSPSD